MLKISKSINSPVKTADLMNSLICRHQKLLLKSIDELQHDVWNLTVFVKYKLFDNLTLLSGPDLSKKRKITSIF